MTYMEYAGWERHERENGFNCGKSDALYGKAMLSRDDMERNMPIGFKDHTTRWEDLIDTRWESYQQGFRSVKRFECSYSSKKEADQSAESMKRNGHSILSIAKRSKYDFVVSAATTRDLPYGAKML